VKNVFIATIFLIAFSMTSAYASSFDLEGSKVEYSFNGGTIVSSQIDKEMYAMILDIDTPTDGDLEITIPRTLIDAKFAGVDDEYIILIDDFDTDYVETENNDKSRTIFIPILEGDMRIEIIGTLDDNSSETESEVPAWIKNNAGWWADGNIDDAAFVNGIQFLIKNGIMKIPETTPVTTAGSDEVPAWIKNNAGWWADGTIDDKTFVQGIQYLVSNGIIKVQ
jgi:hypothetical protein